MRKPLAAIGAVAVSFALGLLISVNYGGSDAGDTDKHPPVELPAAATQVWFPPLSEYDTGGQPLDDDRFDALMADLDDAMTARETLADLERETKVHLWSFFRRLSVSTATDGQQETISAYLTELGERHPDHAAAIASNANLIERYAVPSVAPPPLSSALSSYTYKDWFDAGGKPFEDAQVDGILSGLAAVLETPEAADDFENESAFHFKLFTGRLQRGQVNDEQSARIADYFDKLKARHPESAAMIDEHLFRAEHQTPGRVAANIVGKDTDGVEFKLEDYRGNIVVLIFSGEWCGPCIGEYPYHHFILEQYKNEPLVLLGINSDGSVETIREAKATGRAPSYRTWWDGYGEVSTSGPIATAWDVTAWPEIYVLDEKGVIRHVTGTRGGGLIEIIDKMLMERRTRGYMGPAAITPAKPAEAANEGN